VQLKVNVEI